MPHCQSMTDCRPPYLTHLYFHTIKDYKSEQMPPPPLLGAHLGHREIWRAGYLLRHLTNGWLQLAESSSSATSCIVLHSAAGMVYLEWHGWCPAIPWTLVFRVLYSVACRTGEWWILYPKLQKGIDPSLHHSSAGEPLEVMQKGGSDSLRIDVPYFSPTRNE